MDIRQIIEEKRDFFKAMDLAIDKTLNVQDAQMRKEGRLELDKLRGKDPGVPFFIGYAYEFEYYCSKDTVYAQKAIEEYNNLLLVILIPLILLPLITLSLLYSNN